ncbi:MAG: glyoxylate carboligase [Bifidobacteriaceae bacterium]|jgi:tartronate-semialdehyde synthase|nr:glyoxylate carboligase [Bifidobacteriaceae bacterium]
MAVMRAVDALVQILVKEGVTHAFGVPGAAINPLYSALKSSGAIKHVLVRHVEAATHMAEGFTRAGPHNIGVALGTSGPGGTDMITGLYSAWADSIPILCIVGQVPRAVLGKEDFQYAPNTEIAAPVTKMTATVMEAAQVPGVLAKAFQVMRTGRRGPALLDLPFDVQMAEMDFDIDSYEPLPVANPAMTRFQAEHVLDLLAAAERPLLLAGGGVLISGSEREFVRLAELLGVPVVSTLMGWGTIPDDHELSQGLVGIQTAQIWANRTFLASDLIVGVGNRWANRHTGALDVYRQGRRFVHVDIEPTQIGRIFPPDYGVVSDAGSALQVLLNLTKERQDAGKLRAWSGWVRECGERKSAIGLQRKTHFNSVPLKPQRVYEAVNEAFDRHTRFVTVIGLSQIGAGQMLKVYEPRHWIDAAQAGPLGWTMPAALGAVVADPDTKVVAISGDYDFQFLIEELATGAQHRLPYVHVILNNSYLGLIRQSQRAFDMDYQVRLGFENVNSDTGGYGVDHVAVAQGLGCKAFRVTEPTQLVPTLQEAQRLAYELRLPVIVECIVEKATNLAMGSSLDNVTEFEPLAETIADAPNSIAAK